MADDKPANTWARMRLAMRKPTTEAVTPAVEEPPPVARSKPRVKLPVLKSIPFVRVPAWPTAKTGPKQVTVLDHQPDGTPYIRSYVERYAVGPDDPYYTEARHTVTIFCSRKLEYNVALTACHHYCKAPCPEHLAKLTERGWSTSQLAPPAEQRRKKRKDGEDE